MPRKKNDDISDDTIYDLEIEDSNEDQDSDPGEVGDEKTDPGVLGGLGLLELDSLEQLQFVLERIVEEEMDGQLQRITEYVGRKITASYFLESIKEIVDPVALQKRYLGELEREMETGKISGEEKSACQSAYRERAQEYSSRWIIGESKGRFMLEEREARQYIVIPKSILHLVQEEVKEAEEVSRNTSANLRSEFETDARKQGIYLNEEMRSAVQAFATTPLQETGAFFLVHETKAYEVLMVMTFLVKKYDDIMTV